MSNIKIFLLGMIALALAIVAVPAHSATPVRERARMLPASVSSACPTEDSFNCYWDASTRGNGKGHSFISRKLPGRNLVCIFYTNRTYARTHDACRKEG